MGVGRAADRSGDRRRGGRRARISHELHHCPFPPPRADHDHARSWPVARRGGQQRELVDRRRRRSAGRAHVEAPRGFSIRSLWHHRLHLFARGAVRLLPGGAAIDQLAVRPRPARHSRERDPHACDRGADPRAYPHGLHHRRGDGRRGRRLARADDGDGLARNAELCALRRRAGDPHPGRCRAALWRPRGRDHLHGGARPVLRHQPAILVFLDRNAAGRRGNLPAERHPRRSGAARPLGTEPSVSTSALSTRGLDKSFGSLVVASDIELDLPPGERYALIGPNGAGKTTLINLITGMVKPDRGQMFLGGVDITLLRPEERGRVRLLRTFQINTLFPHLSALEAVTLAVCERRGYAGTWWRKLPAYADAVEEAYAILQSLRLAASCYRPTHELAYGQQRLLEI